MTKHITLLGATGSIGIQTIDIIREHPQEFKLVAFSAGRNLDKTREIIREFSPALVSVQNENDAILLKKEFPGIELAYGSKGLIDVATHPDASVLVNAVLGSVGLESTLEAIKQQKTMILIILQN